MVEGEARHKPRFRLLPDDLETGWMPYVWLVYLCFIPVEGYYRHYSFTSWLATGAGIAVFLGLYFRSYWVDGREQFALACGMVVLAILFAPSNDAAAVYFIFGSCTIAWVQTIGNPYRNVGIYSAVVAIICCALHLSLFSTIYAVGLSALLGVVTARNIERQSTNAALRIAHAEVERMAKVAERERIARDLHDVLGHTLSVIVLKSELAAKLADRDIERAASEIREIEQIARTSLSELREAIAGYRSAGIESELVRARSVLELAGVTVSCRNEPLALTPTQEGVLALAIREGVTNIIRHARASSCRFQLSHGQGTVCLEIADDGRGGSGREGSGLLGMRERVEQLGGSLARDVANGTRLIVTLPT